MTDHTNGVPQTDGPETDDALLRRVGYGLVWGFIAAGVLGYVLISAARPDQDQAARIGLAVYLAFWSGPFIGLSAAVGYHELKKHRWADDHEQAPTPATQGAERPLEVAAAA